jgi:hypothetical protein
MICGLKTLGWKIVEGLLEGGEYSTDALQSPFGHDSSTLMTLSEMAKVIKTQRKITRSLNEGGESSLLDVLARFRFTIATDKKDKAFGLLGLMSDDLGVPVDYSRSVVDIYVDTTRRLINTSRNLDIICQNQWQNLGNEAREPELPSWAPDFSAPGRGKFLFAQRSIFAAGLSECAVPCEYLGLNLLLPGIFLGTIQQIPGHILREFFAMHQSSKMSREKMKRLQLLELANSFGYPNDCVAARYRTGESKLRAFCRTIAGDCRAFPMKRMTEAEIDNDVAFLERCWRDIDDGPSIDRMMSERMRWELTTDWRFGISNNDLFVMFPIASQKGDVVAGLDGAKVPVVLRPLQGGASQEIEY